MTAEPVGAAVSRSATAAFLAFLLAVTLLRSWLMSSTATSLLDYRLDDLLYLRHAKHLIAGEWLGPYDHQLLTKGPGYGIYLAAMQQIGLGRRHAEEALLLLAASALVRTLRCLGFSRLTSGLAFLLLVLAPGSLGPLADRTLREGIYGSQVLLLLALGGRLLVPASLPRRVATSVGVGLIVGWLWITREEGILLVPGVLMLCLGALLVESRRSWRPQVAALWLLGPPLLLPLGMRELVVRQNEHHYGAAVFVETTERNFTRAMAALQRVADARWQRYEPLDAELRRELYRASPALAELAPVLEGPMYRLPFMLAENGERSSVFLMWCVREAASIAGWHRDAAEAKRRYRRLAREVNAAVDRGLVAGGPRRARFAPRMEPSLWPTTVAEGWKLLKDTWELRFPFVEPKPFLPRIEVDEATESWSRRVLREPFSWNPEDAARKREGRRLVTEAWAVVTPWLIASGLAAALLGPVRLRRGAWSAGTLLWATALVLFLSRVAFLAYLRTYFLPSTTHYLMPFYPLLPLASLLALAEGLGSWFRARGPALAGRAYAGRLASFALTGLGIGALLATVALAGEAERRTEPRWLASDRSERVDFGGRHVALALTGLEVATSSAGLSLQATRSSPTLQVHVLDPLRVRTPDLLLDLEWSGPAPLPLVIEYRSAATASGARRRHAVELPGRGRSTLRTSLELPFIESLTLMPSLGPGARLTLHGCRLLPGDPGPQQDGGGA